MKTYDYLENVKEDVRNYIEENKIVVTSSNREEVEQELNDTLFVNDSVTGNASGSYTFSTWQAEENICHNFELLTEALTEFSCDLSYLEKVQRLATLQYVVIFLGRQFRRYWTK